MSVPRLEKHLGLKVYGTNSLGLGGVIRQRIEDFVVEEVLVDGSKAQIDHFPNKVLSSSLFKDRHLICILVKKNWDTFLALRAIARKMGIGPQRIRIAGIKDAKAITAQHITIEDVSAEEARRAKVKDITVHPIGYYRSGLSSYYLLGNEFHITVRSITHSESNIQKRITKTVKSLKEIGGVPNFFGHQRFGTIRPITHLVGKAVIQGNLEKAVMLYLARSSPYEHPDSREARKQLQETQDFQEALRDFPKQLRYERRMLRHLASKSQDFVGALRRLPLKLRRLLPQAYQAYLFNEFLSRRIEEGLPLKRAEIGDYVVNLERSGVPMPRFHKIVDHESIKKVNKAIHDGRMRVTIPLVGFRQSLSRGLQGKIEEQILSQEDIAKEDFKVSSLPETSLGGNLRPVVVPLPVFSSNEISEDNLDPQRYEVKVNFMLYRGSYATILLRELMKPTDITEAGF